MSRRVLCLISLLLAVLLLLIPGAAVSATEDPPTTETSEKPTEPPPPEPVWPDPLASAPEPPAAPAGDIERRDENGSPYYEIPEDWRVSDLLAWFIGTYNVSPDVKAMARQMN